MRTWSVEALDKVLYAPTSATRAEIDDDDDDEDDELLFCRSVESDDSDDDLNSPIEASKPSVLSSNVAVTSCTSPAWYSLLQKK